MIRPGRLPLAALLLVLSACHSRPSATTHAVSTPSGSDAPAATASTVTATAATAAAAHANELGLIPVLEYHSVASPEARWARTPAHLRADLERLYRSGYYLTSLNAVLQNRIDTPAGKAPVVLTFDDSRDNQFRYLPGTPPQLDPDCAVGVLEAFTKAHPDAGKAATFFVLPESLFAQPAYATEKLQWLVAHGYQVGNHTITHSQLRLLTDAQVDHEIGGALAMIHKILPGYPVPALAYPDGSVPKNLALVQRYHQAGLLVGSDPAVSPLSKHWKPLLIPRIQAIDSEFTRHFTQFLDRAPSYRYVSDGDPDHFSIPDRLPAGLTGTLDPKFEHDPRLIRYHVADNKGH